MRKETLKTNGQPIAPTPKNEAYAARIVAEVREKIKLGVFRYDDYFPDSATSTTGAGETVADRLDLWLDLQNTKAYSTQLGYRTSANWWKSKIGDKPLRKLKHSDILAALSSEPNWSGKTKNNKITGLRQALLLAVRDGAITANPIDGLEAAPYQKPEPDPFSQDEAMTIIASAGERFGAVIENYLGIKFFTGVRTSESLALRRSDYDPARKQLVVRRALVNGRLKDSTKTNELRAIHLNSMALHYVTSQLQLGRGEWLFLDPLTGEPWSNNGQFWHRYWVPLMAGLSIRYRGPYQTRHTYATMMLMAGITPAFAAKQMGHSVELFLHTYSKWLGGDADAIEMQRLEAALKPGKYPGK